MCYTKNICANVQSADGWRKGMRLPKEFEEKMRELLKEEFPDYMACYGKPRFYGLRVNTGKITAEEFERICPFPIHPVPWIGNGYYYDGESVTPSKHH